MLDSLLPVETALTILEAADYIEDVRGSRQLGEVAMGKAHESAKEAKKQAVVTLKEKRAAKRARKPVPGSPPFMGHHFQAEARLS